MTETFRGAILAVPPGQLEAGQAFGMSRWQVFREILLPQTIRYALPGFGNNWLVLLKTTALLSVIGLDDVLRMAGQAAGATREPFTFYLAAALIYLVLTSCLDRAARLGRAPCRAALPACRPWTLASSATAWGCTCRGCGRRSGWSRRRGAGPVACRCRWRSRGLRSNPLLNWPVWAYTYFFRGTPLLVQLFLIYYGLGQFRRCRTACSGRCCKQAWFCAVLAFALNTAAYTTEILRGAIEVTPGGGDRGRQGLRHVAVADVAPDHPAQRLSPRPAGLRQRGDLHAAR